MLRLQKFLAQAGVASRREAEKLIAAGEVKVNGEVVTTLGSQVDPARDRIDLKGRRVRVEERFYRLLLKPRECLSTLVDKRDEQGRLRPSLKRYVKDIDLGWKVVGPLDYHTEGVLLLTTDGELAERISKRKMRVSMTYHVKFQGGISDAEVVRLEKGWRTEEGPLRPESVALLATTGKNTWVEMVVRDARPRALRAAGSVIRKHVLKLSRTHFGDLSFEGLKMGEHRDLTKLEVASLLRTAVG